MSTAISHFPIPPIVKIVTVRCSPCDAFRVFTADIGRWYPLMRFSIAAAVDCCFEPGIGGRLYEIGVDGQERLWGHVLAWDPPNALALSWQARCSEEEAQRIDITFRAVTGGTEVRLVHASWENLKVDGAEWRDKYDGGWVEVFEWRFKAYADEAA